SRRARIRLTTGGRGQSSSQATRVGRNYDGISRDSAGTCGAPPRTNMSVSVVISPEQLRTITGGADAAAPATSTASSIGELIAPKDCNSELGLGGMLTAAELARHTPGPWFVKVGAGLVGAVAGLSTGCRLGTPGK